MNRAVRQTRIEDQSGMLAVDFLFSFTLVSSLTILLLSVTFTLSIFEITQYMTYSAARNYMAAHLSPLKQQEIAAQKWNELRALPALVPLFSGGWYQLGQPEVGPQADARFINEYASAPDQNPERTMFTGFRVSLNAKVLEIRVPFFGNTFDEEDGFTTRISSFLLREPTFVECMGFNEQRWNRIRDLNGDYQRANMNNAYIVMGDNGC